MVCQCYIHARRNTLVFGEVCRKCNKFYRSKGERINDADRELRKALERIKDLGVSVRCSDGMGRISPTEFPVLEVDQ